ncbi:Ig-like domain-containing protein, partial [Enterobacter bugandensis]
RDKDTILADGTDKSTLTLTLNDALNQKVKGQAVEFVTDKGTVGATTDNHDGTYTAALTAAPGVTGTANISVKVGGNVFGTLKTTVTLAAIAAFKDILVRDGHTFNIGDGFPSTADINSLFEIRIKGATASDYDWHADKRWVGVIDGKVTFTSTPTSKEKITITATPKSGPGYVQKSSLHYSFTITDWFINHAGYGKLEWLVAKTKCTGSDDIPTKDNLTKGTSVRGVGSYWSEWGRDSLPGNLGDGYWTSTPSSPGSRLVVDSDGQVSETADGTVSGSSFVFVVCHRTL